MKKAALFDLDGVIVDTEPCYTEFWETVGLDFFPENRRFALSIKGHTLTYILEKYFPGDEDKHFLIKKRLEEHQKRMHYPFIPGVMDFIRKLRENSVYVAVVTSSDQKKMKCLLDEHPDFMSYFHRIFTAEDALRSKPAPDCYLAAAKFFGLAPDECVVFEDSFNGLEAGRASGAFVVGLSTSNAPEELVGACDRVVPDFVDSDQLLDLFR